MDDAALIGWRWRKARKVLTSTDPEYRAKAHHIRSILAELHENEAFFSINEFGPFSVRAQGGRALVGPSEIPTVPLYQKFNGQPYHDRRARALTKSNHPQHVLGADQAHACWRLNSRARAQSGPLSAFAWTPRRRLASACAMIVCTAATSPSASGARPRSTARRWTRPRLAGRLDHLGRAVHAAYRGRWPALREQSGQVPRAAAHVDHVSGKFSSDPGEQVKKRPGALASKPQIQGRVPHGGQSLSDTVLT